MSSGYGQQSPYDTTSPLAGVTFIIRQMLARMNTMKVVQVKKVHSSGGISVAGTVDVLPLVSQVDGNGNAQPHGIIPGVQYFRIQGGVNAIICDPDVGDIGFVVVSDRDTTNIKNGQSQPVTPGCFRRNDLADGVYIGGILNTVPKQTVQFTSTGIVLTDMNGNTFTLGPSGISFTDLFGNQMTTLSGAINFTTLALQVNGVPVTVP